MDGTIAKLDKICELAKKYNSLVFVDDCHATGFVGKNGKGSQEENNVIGKIDIDDVSDNASISLDLGYGLISMVDSNDKKSAGPLISKITGITNSMVSNSPNIKKVLPAFIEFVNNNN